MANKAFEIQESTLRIGGLDLEAGTTQIVIPGISQATTYRVEEVDERDGNNPDTFGNNKNAITVIDNAEYVYQSGGAQPSSSYVSAAYSVNELDDGEIDEIDVDIEGTFESADKTRAEAGNMWATTVADPFAAFNTGDWAQIPFRPKLRAGEVTNIGGSGSSDRLTSGLHSLVLASNSDLKVPGVIKPNDESPSYIDVFDSRVLLQSSQGVQWSFGSDGDLQLPAGGDIVNSSGTSVLGGGGVGSGVAFREVVYPTGAVGDTQGTIAVNAAGETFIAIADYDEGAVPTFTVQHTTVDYGQSAPGSGQSQVVIDLTEYTDLKNYVLSNSIFMGDEEISFDGGVTWINPVSYTGLSWQQDPPFLSLTYVGDQPEDGDEVIVRFPTDVVNVWIKPNMGDLTITGDNLTGEVDVQITAGDDIRIYAQDDISLRSYSTDGGSVLVSTNYNESNEHNWQFSNTGIFTLPGSNYLETTDINLKIGSQGSVIIRSDAESSETTNTWEFDNRGALRLPEGGDIIDSNGDSVLGGGGNSYTPEDADNWNSPAVNTVAAALDELAAKVAALQNFEIDGGNANTPALGEILIDGNGA